jgi:hypothetical protein
VNWRIADQKHKEEEEMQIKQVIRLDDAHFLNVDEAGPSATADAAPLCLASPSKDNELVFFTMRMTLSGVNRSRGENYLPF